MGLADHAARRRPVVLEDAGAGRHDVGLDGHVVLEVPLHDPVEELGIAVRLAQLLQLAGHRLGPLALLLGRQGRPGRLRGGEHDQLARVVIVERGEDLPWASQYSKTLRVSTSLSG